MARPDARRAADAAGTPLLRPARTDDTAPWPQTDPFAPVYIVTSRDTWQGIRGLARGAVARLDSTGMPLVIAETRADRLGEIGRYVHLNERRCGGYFASPRARRPRRSCARAVRGRRWRNRCSPATRSTTRSP